MRKGIKMALTVICLAGLVGCGKEQEGKNPEQGQQQQEQLQQETMDNPGASKEPGGKLEVEVRLKSKVEFTPEDYDRANAMLNETETGYYYYSEIQGGLRYMDKKTGIDMYLCNKPECRHDGNAFCVATNDIYAIESYCIYNGKLLANVIEETDTQYIYKVVMIALDGSKVEEIATYLTLQKTQQSLTAYDKGSNLLIHRNKIIIPMRIVGQGELGDSGYYGTFILDMDTWELNGLGEELLSKDNEEILDFTVHGDYLYYCRKETKKTVLCRYHLTEHTEERYKLSVGFSGEYAVLDDNTLVYKSPSSLRVHHHDTGINEEKATWVSTWKQRVITNGELVELELTTSYEVVLLMSDGEYIYAVEQAGCITDPKTGEEIWQRYVHVFDRDFNEILALDYYDAVKTVVVTVLPDVSSYSNPEFFCDGKELYMTTTIKTDSDYWRLVLRGKRSDFLAGNPKFEVVLKKQY